jgi:hypothetical protein
LPASAALYTYAVPVGDQGAIGSCVAWAIDYAMLGWYANKAGRTGVSGHPMYTYSQIHADWSATGGGSQPQDALNIALNQGNDTMAHYAHSLTDFTNRPTASEVQNAATFRITGWQTIVATAGGGQATIDAIKTAIAGGKPVAFAMPIRDIDGYESTADGFRTLTSTNYAWDNITSPIIGLHEMLALAYDADGLWVQNSWGAGWGYSGYARLSWRVVANDIRVAHTISGLAAAADTTAPTVTAPLEQIVLRSAATTTTVPVQLTWNASDPSGIAQTELWVSTNGGTYVQDTSVTTQTSRFYTLTKGATYRFAVRAKDGAGNWSGYQYSQPLTPGLTDDTTFSIASPWSRYSWTSGLGGSAITTSTAGATLTYTFTGRDVALVAPTFSTAGRASVYCDGSYVGMVDLYSSTLTSQTTQYWCRFTSSTTHTMKIVVEGTYGRPRFDVDAFVTLA